MIYGKSVCSCRLILPPAPASCLLPPGPPPISLPSRRLPVYIFARESHGCPADLAFPTVSSPSQNFTSRRLAMKRCSQCHFTFSDDEQFCGFDNIELTALHAKPHALPKLPSGFRGR